MSVWEKIRRLINSQKFYATLPSKLDRAEEQWHESQPENGPDVTVTEYEPDGSEAQILLGGALSLRRLQLRSPTCVQTRQLLQYC